MEGPHAIVARLIEEGADRPPSRNRNFEAWTSPENQEAYKLFWRLVDIERDLDAVREGGGRAALEEHDDGSRSIAYALELPQGRARRLAHLDEAEWALLERMCRPLLDEVLAPAEG